MDDKERYNPSKYLSDKPSPADKAGLLPGPNTPYTAAATAFESDVPQLVVIMGKAGFEPGGVAYHNFPYSHIDPGEFGFTAEGGHVFRYPFNGLQPRLLTVHGRDLLRMWQQIGAKRLPWIRQADRDFRLVVGGEADEPFITRIEVTDWEPKPKEKTARIKAMDVELA